MKKLLATALIATMSLAITSCAGNGENNSEENPQLEKCHPYQAFSAYMHINDYCNLIETLASGYAKNADLGREHDKAGALIIDGPGENLVLDLKNEERYYDVIMNDMRMLREMPEQYKWCSKGLLKCESDIKELHKAITNIDIYWNYMDRLWSTLAMRFQSIAIRQVAFSEEFHDSIGTETPEVIMEKFK